MLYEKIFRNKREIGKLIEEIKRLGIKRVNLMEVCGTHTYTYFRFGLRYLLSDYVNLISGPGCPVCVTPSEFIDKAIILSKDRKNIIATFGDLMRVRGSISSLYEEKAKGAKIKVVYSAEEAFQLACQSKERVIFLGIGFETTAPSIASLVKKAKEKKIRNFFLLSALRLIPPAMKKICEDKYINIEGFICPGHVSAIIGELPYREIVRRYKKGCVIAGFEPLDLVLSVYILLLQKKRKKAELENEYKRVVRREGNLLAKKIMEEVFRPGTAEWRGLGKIEESGLFLRKKYQEFDAHNLLSKFKLESIKKDESKNKCLCGEVIKGKITPYGCPQFRKNCTPSNPLGPCMISFEGTCRIYYMYENGKEVKWMRF